MVENVREWQRILGEMVAGVVIKVCTLSRTPPNVKTPQRHSQDRQEGTTNPLTDTTYLIYTNKVSKG